MTYVLGQMLLWAAIFFLAGLLTGWLGWGRWAGRTARALSVEVDTLRTAATRQEAALAEREGELAEADRMHAALQGELDDARQATAVAHQQVAAAEAATERAGQAEREAQERAEAAQAARQLAERRASGAEADVQVLQAQLGARDRTMTELQERLAAAEASVAALQAQAVAAEPDDLKKIQGVGRVLEGLLHEAGIATFEQLAALSDRDVEQLDGRLEEFRGRIRREGWIEQARRLHEEKHGVPLARPGSPALSSPS